MTPVEQLGEVSWSVVCAGMLLYGIGFFLLLCIYVYLIYFLLLWPFLLKKKKIPPPPLYMSVVTLIHKQWVHFTQSVLMLWIPLLAKDFLLVFLSLNASDQQRKLTAFNRQGTQQQRPESSTVSLPGMWVNTGYINSNTVHPPMCNAVNTVTM